MCEQVKFADGGTAIICGRRHHRPWQCEFCRERQQTKLCDFPVKRDGKEGTCDARMCTRCSTSVGRDTDYCPNHKSENPQGVLPL